MPKIDGVEQTLKWLYKFLNDYHRYKFQYDGTLNAAAWWMVYGITNYRSKANVKR